MDYCKSSSVVQAWVEPTSRRLCLTAQHSSVLTSLSSSSHVLLANTHTQAVVKGRVISCVIDRCQPTRSSRLGPSGFGGCVVYFYPPGVSAHSARQEMERIGTRCPVSTSQPPLDTYVQRESFCGGTAKGSPSAYILQRGGKLTGSSCNFTAATPSKETSRAGTSYLVHVQHSPERKTQLHGGGSGRETEECVPISCFYPVAPRARCRSWASKVHRAHSGPLRWLLFVQPPPLTAEYTLRIWRPLSWSCFARTSWTLLFD